jgi:hypothetical protein
MKSNLKLWLAVATVCVALSAMSQAGLIPPEGLRPPLRPPPPIGIFPPPPIFIQQPLNDTFADRTAISSFFPAATTYWISGSLSNATSEAGEPLINGISSGQTIWGTWTAPSNGSVTLFLNAGPYSPLLTVYAGSAPISGPSANGAFPGSAIIQSVFTNLSLVASNNYLACYDDVVCGCHWRERDQITFHVQSGQAYQICVDSAIITDASWENIPETPEMVPIVTPIIGLNGIVGYETNYFTIFPILGSGSWSLTQTTNTPDGGEVQLGLKFTPVPINDDFANRIKLSGSRVFITTSNAGATKELGEPDHLENPGGSSVWFTWTAPASGRVTLSTNEVPAYAPPAASGGDGSSTIIILNPVGAPTCGNLVDQNPPPVFYPVFAAYTGTNVAELTPADNLPAALAAFPNLVEFDAVKGQTYQIAFDGNLGTTGEIPFYLDLTTPAANDNFASRILLHGIYASATSYNAGATHQIGEPFFGNSTGKTVWWSWLAPVSGTVSIDLSGSDYAFPAAVFTGRTLAVLQQVATGAGGVTFEAVAGQTYQIAVGDDAGLTGEIQLKLSAPIVGLVLSRIIPGAENSARLVYGATAGEVIVFQRSTDGTNWQSLQTMVTTQNTVEFVVQKTPTVNGPFYRAVIVDRTF